MLRALGRAGASDENSMLTLFRALERVSPAGFLWLTVLAIIATRALVIAATPAYGELIDLSIYREAGELVVNGVDPYDWRAERARRESFRLDGRGADAYVSATQERWDHFVSSNLPGSTLLYALFEWLSGGSPLGWRVALVLGDLSMLLGAYLLCVRAGLDLRRAENRLGFLTLLVAYPSLLMWGTLVPEDKQFQTGLMLVSAALILPASERLSTAGRSIGAAAALGATLALSILFKALGGVLLPPALRSLAARSRREQIWFGVAFLATIGVVVAPFSTSFLPLIAKRVHSGSIEEAQHGSPWTLLPWPALVTYLRPAAFLGALALIMRSFLSKRIDLLNALAATLVAFICLWITNGSMDRMNITMVFAAFCLVTASESGWWKLALANAAFQSLAYVSAIVLRGANSDAIEQGDAASTAFFLVTYFATLSMSRARSAAWQPEPQAA